LKVKNNEKFELNNKCNTYGFETKFFEEKEPDMAAEKD
jgi:hypothetical protein